MTYFSGFENCLAYIEEHITEKMDYGKLYEMAGMSKTSFQRFFLFIFDMSLQDYIRKMKLRSAANMLVNTNTGISEIALIHGYDNQASFTRAAKKEYGKTPLEIRNGKKYNSISPFRLQQTMRKGDLLMNEKILVSVREIKNSHVIAFDVDCFDAEEVAWNQMKEWANANLKDKVARCYVGLAPIGHHPKGQHENASEHVKHPYKAMVLLLDDEVKDDEFCGKKIENGPDGLYLVNDVSLNQYDENGVLDMAMCMIKASEAFVEFVKNTDVYEFDCGAGIFYEEHVFDEKWFAKGGTPSAFRMWVPVKRKA